MFFRSLLVVSLLTFTAFFACAEPASHPEPYLDKQEIKEIVDQSIDALSRHYLFADKTEAVVERLRHETTEGEFTRGYPFGQFRQKFESILVTGTSDTGFELLERSPATPLNGLSGVAESNAIETEVLQGNIGYLKLTGDFLQSDRRKDLTSSLSQLITAEALIIDLRDVGVASMDFAQHLTSFFLTPGTIMATVSFNATQSPISLPAKAQPGFARFSTDLPLYILTSGFVSGPWEFFSYTLKHYEVATLIGEDTMGVSYMKKTLPVSKHAALTLYYAQISHPVTDDNWHHTGVFADYQVSAQASYEKARELAITTLNGNNALPE